MSVDRHRRAVNMAQNGLDLLAHLLPSASRDGREQALGELEDLDTRKVQAIAYAIHAGVEAGDLLDSWEDRRVRDRAFADAIEEVLVASVPLEQARARLTVIVHALRVADDEPEPWKPSA